MQKKPYELIEMSEEEDTISMYLEQNKDMDTQQSSKSSQQMQRTKTNKSSGTKNSKECELSVDTIMGLEENIDYNAHDVLAAEGYVEITIIKTEKDKITDDKVRTFINFCLEKDLFDDTNYDYNNVFSIISTKLPTTFDTISENKKTIDKETFMSMFKEKYNYEGELDYVYSLMDRDNKRYISWDDFREFFLPYIQNIIA